MLLAFSVGLLAFCLIIIIANLLLKDKFAMNIRLNNLSGTNNKSLVINIDKKKKEKFKLLSNLKFIDKLELELTSAGILMRAEEFLIIWIILIFVPSGFVVLLSGSIITASSLIFIGVMGPVFYVMRSKKKRVEQFTIQLSDALITLGNCLRSGLSIIQGIESISNEMPDPIGKEFKKVFKEINYGVSVEKALDNLTQRVKCEELNLIVSAIIIQREIGGNLSVILSNVSETIKERLKVKAEIKVLTATGRMSGFVVGFLPLGIGLILMLLTPDYMSALFSTQIGRWMLFSAMMLEVIGFSIIQKMVTVKY